MAPDLYTQHADVIEAALAYTRRAHRLSADAADEFASWALLKLIDNDYAILRKFEGRSNMRTFLISVVQHLFLDWRNAQWGKWRPTAVARRMGHLAIELERLIIRDDMSFGEAAELLVSRGVARSRDDCEAAWALLPQRPSRRVANESELRNVPAREHANDTVISSERHARGRAASAAMAQALSSLESQDQLIFRLRFYESFTVARIALLLETDQKGLYRRFDRLLEVVRASMVAMGVSPSDASDLVSNPGGELQPVFDGPAGNRKTRPSRGTSTGGEHD